jgi:hypothetical protein
MPTQTTSSAANNGQSKFCEILQVTESAAILTFGTNFSCHQIDGTCIAALSSVTQRNREDAGVVTGAVICRPQFDASVAPAVTPRDDLCL